jgi:hypothetical protein
MSEPIFEENDATGYASVRLEEAAIEAAARDDQA